MKTIGLIGGTSWLSTIDYYTYINRMVNEKMGGVHSARLVMHSIDMDDLRKFAEHSDWAGLAKYLTTISNDLQKAGAEAIVICANTPHVAADTVRKNIFIPLIHIAEETAKEIQRKKLKKIILLGTMVTMEHTFFSGILSKHGIETIIPEKEDREFIHTSIFSELGKEIFKPETKRRYLEIIKSLQKKGGEGAILGCTEIPLLIKPTDAAIPLFDTTMIHSKAAVEFMFS